MHAPDAQVTRTRALLALPRPLLEYPRAMVFACWVALAGAPGCSAKSDAGGCSRGRSVSTTASSPSTPTAPNSAERPRTTAAAIAIGNLNGDIDEALATIARKSKGGEQRAIPRLLLRAQALGILADLDTALDVATTYAAANPKDAEAWLLLATTQAALHRFDAALDSLQKAQTAGAETYLVDQQRASVYLALGRIDEAVTAHGQLVTSADGYTVAAAYADALGKPADAVVLLDKARTAFRDVSPFTLAWMDMQRARSAERRGAIPEAKRLLTEALDVLPSYAHAAAHLAALETAPKALAVLDALDPRCDDPEVFAARADAQRRAGKTEEAQATAERARARFDALLQAHPSAFADHAARFYMGVGQNAERALTLAEQNAKVRPTSESIFLWLTAAQAASNRSSTCAASNAGRALKYAMPAEASSFTEAQSTCTNSP
jgi:tetratricopeptide (TPR) repeat protein